MQDLTFNVVPVTVESGRVRIPDRLARRMDWLEGGEALDAWLLILQPGRFRLLSHPQVKASEGLKEVLQRITEPDSPLTGDPVKAESLEMAALSARLVPTTISPKGPGWRLTWPRALFPSGAMQSGTTLYLLVSDGYLELWFEDLLKRALETPLDQLLP